MRLAGQSMYRMFEYPGRWSVFVNGQGINVVNLFSGNHSQGFQGMGGPTASAGSPAAPDPRSSQLATTVTKLPSSSIQGATFMSKPTQVSNSLVWRHDENL